MARVLLLLFIFSVTATSIGVAEAQAKKSIWAILFPYHVEQTEDSAESADLTETKQAPFVDPAAQKSAEEKNDPLSELYGAPVDIEGGTGTLMEKPHRHQKQIAVWLLKVIADILAVDPENYQGHLQSIATLLDAKALGEFDKFMQESRTLETLAANGMTLTGIVEEDPLLLNKAPLGGRYRWLFEMPVTLTFLPKGVSSYDNVEPISHSVLLRVQVGRIEPAEGQEDIIIESFDVRRNSEN